jgi:hypothetical protein
MFKKIIAGLLIIFWLYILLIFLTPWFTDSLENKIWITFSKKLRFLKKVFDWKKTFSEFKKFIYEDNPDIKKIWDSINSSVSWVKKIVDSSRKNLLDTKKSIDENIEMVENWIEKVKETKQKIEDVTDVLKWKSRDNKFKENKTLEDKIDEKITKEIIENEKDNFEEEKKINYEIMWDINDF